jgi:hypothetical protein
MPIPANECAKPLYGTLERDVIASWRTVYGIENATPPLPAPAAELL